MPQITVLSLNMQGVNANTVARAIKSIRPDLVALQEAPARNHRFYSDLSAVISNRYEVTSPLREYPKPPPKIGGFSLDSQGSMKNYILIYDTNTLGLQDFDLVDFLNDINLPKPRDVDDGRAMGFASRPPAYAKFTHFPDGGTIGVFIWHAPTNTDPYHLSMMRHFDQSNWLLSEQVNNDLTLLLGDFNNSKINAYFRAFDEGVQHKFDYILCDNSINFEDLSQGVYRRLLDDVHTTTQDHFMMGATITY